MREDRAWSDVGRLGVLGETQKERRSPFSPSKWRKRKENCSRRPQGTPSQTPERGAPGVLLRARGPQVSGRSVPTGAPAAAELLSPPRLTSARRKHPPPLPQPPGKRLPMPGGRRHSGALSSPGKPRRARSWVHPPESHRPRVRAGGGDLPACRPASSRSPRLARWVPVGATHLMTPRPPPPSRPPRVPRPGLAAPAPAPTRALFAPPERAPRA